MSYKQIGLTLLAAWLITQGLGSLFKFYFPYGDKILPVINLSAGLFLLMYGIKLKHGDIGLFLLGIWAVLRSGLFLFNYSFPYSNTILDILGIVAGIMLIVRI
jgi:hypothetical protein